MTTRVRNKPAARDARRPAQATIGSAQGLRREQRWSHAALAFTIVVLGLFLVDVILAPASVGTTAAVSSFIFYCIVAGLLYGNLVYQLTRLAHLRRLDRHRSVKEPALANFDADNAPAVTILVPTYKEETRVVAMTLWSAALQQYPNRRVVLLIDDPPVAETSAEYADLVAMRDLPHRLQERFDRPRRRFAALADAFAARRHVGQWDAHLEMARLAAAHAELAEWFEREIHAPRAKTSMDCSFVASVLKPLRDHYRAEAERLRVELARAAKMSSEEVARGYRRLVAQFNVELSSFERKRYINLSHEPNKAMNLNSYIALMGHGVRERLEQDARYLDVVEPGGGERHIRDSRYILTLDADSLLRPDYTSCLVYLMEQPDNTRLAVAQTPYSTFPGASGAIERIAGATTDIQFLIHQGYTDYGASFWVGANALLRKLALEDIVVYERERGFSVAKYIQDRTVIEDTESSIDLISRGWRLFNYPERLAYSATPPDFGSLIVQRRRWANGGLIILPKLLRYLTGKLSWTRIQECFFRLHYLISIALVNFGLLILLAVPFPAVEQSIWLPFTALPYFLLYGRDLLRLGYRATDVLRVYALNLLLIPVNLAGVIKSLHQAVTGSKIPFARTPKVAGRTAAAPVYVMAPAGLAVYWLLQAALDVMLGYRAHAGFALVNSVLMIYALLNFVGLHAAAQDLRAVWIADAGRAAAGIFVRRLGFLEILRRTDFRARTVAPTRREEVTRTSTRMFRVARRLRAEGARPKASVRK